MSSASGIELIGLLEDKIKRSSQKEIAQELGISPQYLNDIVREKRSISKKLANKLGYEKVTMFVLK